MGSTGPGPIAGVRVATAAHASDIANTLALGFQNDPLWAWAFPDSAQRYRLWGGAKRHPYSGEAVKT
jgi:hypothetical protein